MDAWWLACVIRNAHTDSCMCKNSSGPSTLITFLPVPSGRVTYFARRLQILSVVCVMCTALTFSSVFWMILE